MALLIRIMVLVASVCMLLLCMAPSVSAQETLNEGNAFQQEFARCMEGDQGYLPGYVHGVTDNLGQVGEGVANFDRRFYCLDQAFTHNPGDAITAGLSNAASEFWGDPVGDFVKAVMEGNSQALQTVMTLWTDYRLDKTAVDSSVQGVKNIVFSLTAFALIASMIVGGGRIAASRRMGLSDGLEETGTVVVMFLIFAFLIPPMVAGAVLASDALSDWIIQSFGAAGSEELFKAASLDESIMGPILMLVLVGIALAGSAVQIVALAFRTLLLPVAAGLLPVFAASSFSEIGRAGLNHLISLMIAAIVFKPISALLYCVVFWIASQPGDDRLVTTIINVILVGAAGFCGPALVRALVPAVAQAGGGNAGGMLGVGAAVVGSALGLAGAGTAVGAAASSSKSQENQATNSTTGADTTNVGSVGQAVGGSANGGKSSTGGGGASGGSATQPSGAVASSTTRGSGAKSDDGNQPRMRERGAAVAAGAQRIATSARRGVSTALTGGATIARSAEHAATRVERIFDENLGATGAYHGQVRR